MKNSVAPQKDHDGQRSNVHIVQVEQEHCSCGLWQEHLIPCIHAIAYFRSVKELTLQQIIEANVSKLYYYESLQELYKDNFYPVVVDNLVPDKVTELPTNQNKRQAGRPVTKRLRKRCKFPDPTLSNIKCSRCGQKGHNKKTCELRSITLLNPDQQNNDTIL